MMLRTVFGKALRDQRWALVGWGGGVVLLVLVEAAVWPTFSDMPDMEQFLNNYPEAFRKLFDLTSMTTGTGFMNAELFTLMLPLLFIVFAVGRGARMIAGEEESGVLEVVLATPVSTRSVLLQKAAALVVGVTVLGAVLAVVLLLCSAVFGLGIGVGSALSGCVAMVLMGVEFGALALAVGASTGRRALAIGVAGAAAVAAYVLYALALIVDAFEPWQPLSPFHQALHAGPLGSGLPASSALVALGAVVVLAAAVPVFERRDLRLR
ncbi:MAG TPA: ABC transporter permease subunit [Nocardioides sp.]|jgi:ABC-2 type transport system permease protein|nr:ABC transporter permease subunit [Nocardioides sp.]